MVKNLTKTEILEDIKDLESKLEERKQQLREAEIREYDDALKGFLERFSIQSAEDVYRLQNALEGIQGVVKAPQVIVPHENTATDKKTDGFDSVKLFGSEPVVVPIPTKGQHETAVEGGSADEHDSDWTQDAEPTLKDPEVVAEAGSKTEPEPIHEESIPDPFPDEPAEESEKKAEDSAEEIKVGPTPEAEEDPFHIDYSIFDRFSDDNVEIPDDNMAAGALMDFTDAIPAEFDNSGIDAGLVIAVNNPDPSVSKFKGRPAIVNAEKILLEAIAEAVKEGWVGKEEVMDRFFKAEDTPGEDFYAEAESIVDHLEGIWQKDGIQAGASEAKLKEFMALPFHTRAKAAACARSDLQIALA